MSTACPVDTYALSSCSEERNDPTGQAGGIQFARNNSTFSNRTYDYRRISSVNLFLELTGITRERTEP